MLLRHYPNTIKLRPDLEYTLTDAVHRGDLCAVTALVSHYGPDGTQFESLPPIYFAAYLGHREIFEYLLQTRFDHANNLVDFLVRMVPHVTYLESVLRSPKFVCPEYTETFRAALLRKPDAFLLLYRHPDFRAMFLTAESRGHFIGRTIIGRSLDVLCVLIDDQFFDEWIKCTYYIGWARTWREMKPIMPCLEAIAARSPNPADMWNDFVYYLSDKCDLLCRRNFLMRYCAVVGCVKFSSSVFWGTLVVRYLKIHRAGLQIENPYELLATLLRHEPSIEIDELVQLLFATYDFRRHDLSAWPTNHVVKCWSDHPPFWE
jgi:hypothetical protein